MDDAPEHLRGRTAPWGLAAGIALAVLTALAFIFLYHLTQVVPGFVGGVLVLVLEGETLFGKQSLFSFRPPELPDVAHVAPEPDPG